MLIKTTTAGTASDCEAIRRRKSVVSWLTHESIREGVYLLLYSINTNFTNMSCKALFLYIMPGLFEMKTSEISVPLILKMF